MLIPKYWAQYKQRFESRETPNKPSKQATIKRYGWSDVSQSEALSHAKLRVNDAHKRWLAGEDIVRRERREEYNASNGIPIREEIISEHSFPESGLPNNNAPTTQLIVTRNSYGAQVANVDNIAIIDIDTIDLFAQLYPEDYANFGMKWFWEDALSSNKVFDSDSSDYYLKLWTHNDSKRSSMKPQVIGFIIASIIIASIITWLGLTWIWLIAFMVVIMSYLWQQARKKEKAIKQENKQKMLTMVESINPYITDLLNKRVASHTNEQFRLYKTPAGFRIIATHDTIAPNDSIVAEWFATFHADANYARLCQSQQCFRARLTAKPWRMTEVEDNSLAKEIPAKNFWFGSDNTDVDNGIEQRQDALKARKQWMADYGKYSKNYRACHYVESMIGKEADNNSKAQASIDDFVKWHDRACQVNEDLPLA